MKLSNQCTPNFFKCITAAWMSVYLHVLCGQSKLPFVSVIVWFCVRPIQTMCAFCTLRSEETRLNCSALFDGCFLTLSLARCAVPWWWYYVLWAQLSGEKSRAAAPWALPLPPPQTPYCEKSLGRALWAQCIHCLAKCWPDWKAQCPWAWLILSILSEALSHKQWERG